MMARSPTLLLVLAAVAAVLACVDAARVAGHHHDRPDHEPGYEPDYQSDYYGRREQEGPDSYPGPTTFFDEFDDDDIVRVNLFAMTDQAIIVGAPEKKAVDGKAGVTPLPPNQFADVFQMKLSCDVPSDPHYYSEFPTAAVPFELPTLGVFKGKSITLGVAPGLTNPLGLYKLWGQVAVLMGVLNQVELLFDPRAAPACDRRLEGISGLKAVEGALGFYSIVARPQWTLDARHFYEYYTAYMPTMPPSSKRTQSDGADTSTKLLDLDCGVASVLHGPVTFYKGDTPYANGTLTVVYNMVYPIDKLQILNPSDDFPDPTKNEFLSYAVKEFVMMYKGLKNMCDKYSHSIPTVVPNLMHLEFPRQRD